MVKVGEVYKLQSQYDEHPSYEIIWKTQDKMSWCLNIDLNWEYKVLTYYAKHCSRYLEEDKITYLKSDLLDKFCEIMKLHRFDHEYLRSIVKTTPVEKKISKGDLLHKNHEYYALVYDINHDKANVFLYDKVAESFHISVIYDLNFWEKCDVKQMKEFVNLPTISKFEDVVEYLKEWRV